MLLWGSHFSLSLCFIFYFLYPTFSFPPFPPSLPQSKSFGLWNRAIFHSFSSSFYSCFQLHHFFFWIPNAVFFCLTFFHPSFFPSFSFSPFGFSSQKYTWRETGGSHTRFWEKERERGTRKISWKQEDATVAKGRERKREKDERKRKIEVRCLKQIMSCLLSFSLQHEIWWWIWSRHDMSLALLFAPLFSDTAFLSISFRWMSL